MRSTPTSLKVTPGSGLLDPVVVVALAGLLLNDHLLKAASAGTSWTIVTGKLSDFCGVLFLPVLVVAGVEFVASWRHRFSGPSVRTAVVVAVAVAVFFTLMNTIDVVGDIYALTLAALQWPLRATAALWQSQALPSVVAVRHVVDPTDTIAVPAAAWVVVQARVRAASWAMSGATNVSYSSR